MSLVLTCLTTHQNPAVLFLSNPPHVASSEQGVLGGVIHHSLPDIDDGVPGDIGPGAPPETAHHPLVPGNAGVGVQHSPGNRVYSSVVYC